MLQICMHKTNMKYIKLNLVKTWDNNWCHMNHWFKQAESVRQHFIVDKWSLYKCIKSFSIYSVTFVLFCSIAATFYFYIYHSERLYYNLSVATALPISQCCCLSLPCSGWVREVWIQIRYALLTINKGITRE